VCGIVGIWEFNGAVDRELLESMRDTLTHRGPDDDGVYLGDSGRVGLGHRRLTVLDLTPAGHQPMSYRGTWTVHNGEVYNFRSLRERLAGEGHSFASNTDTEVILKGFNEWGLDAIHHFRGMFATALWDSTERKLHLVRDRAGVKPLYYYKDADRFIFASELRAILLHPAVQRDVDRGALALYLKLGYVPAPQSIFRHVAKLEAGHILTVDADARMENRSYWDVFDCFRGRRDVDMSEDEAADELERILTDSFKLRTVADVPVGVFLSGGIDSSTVAALLQKDATKPVRTFTIGFTDQAYDEAQSAASVAAHLGTDHHELYLDPNSAMEIIPQLPEIYDEPFGDASGIPTYLVAKFARESVKVALSADGGDELFAGYQMYANIMQSYRMLASLGPLRNLAIEAAGAFPLKQLLGKRLGPIDIKLKKLRSSLDNGFSISNLFWAGKSLWTNPEIRRLLDWGFDPSTEFLAPYTDFEREVDGIVDFMRAADYRSYLADDILVKVDRASMAVSLEGRDPLLDHHVVEFVAGLPDRFLVRNGITKYLLRRVLYRYVPKPLIDRPKRGFTVPLETWLRADL
jgi:asparagine synthase (glutamine-hydrolysing)